MNENQPKHDRFKIDEKYNSFFKYLEENIKISQKNLRALIALHYSLSLSFKFSIKSINNFSDNLGQEFRYESLFQKDEVIKLFHEQLLSYFYDEKLNNEQFRDLLKAHIQHGLEAIVTEMKNNKNNPMDVFIDKIKTGVEYLPIMGNQENVEDINDYKGFKKPVQFILGKLLDGSELKVTINNVKQFENLNIAIAGTTGSGKTQLVQDILYQIHKNTNGELKFIFFDYKGTSDDNSLKSFIDSTNTKLISLENKVFNFNPLRFLRLEGNEQQLENDLNLLVDGICDINPGVGQVQKQRLRIIIKDVIKRLNHKYPTLADIGSESKEYYSGKDAPCPDSLSELLYQLSLGLFCKDDNEHDENLFNNNFYFNLPPALASSKKLTFCYLILLYIYLKATTDVKDENSIKPIKYVIVIDEAHNYLASKPLRKQLEVMIRTLRSRGIIIILISQNPTDYKKDEFEFSELVSLPICLNVSNKSETNIRPYLGGIKNNPELQNCINGLKSGNGILNIQDNMNLIEINQFWKRGL